MPEYLAPGVYVEEVDTGIKTIEGVSTSVAGFVGMTRRGRVTGLPQLVTSFNEFQRMFGGFFDSTFGAKFNNMPYAVDGFFANGGRQLYVVRVLKGGTKASKVTTGGMITRLQPGTTAVVGTDTLNVVSLRGVAVLPVATKIKLLQDKNGVVHTSGDLTVKAIDPATNQITLTTNIDSTPALLPFYEPQYTTVLTNVETLDADGLLDPLTNLPDPRPNSFTISSKDEGSWGKSIVITSSSTNGARAEVNDAASGGGVDAVVIKVPSTAGFYVNAWVEIDRGKTKRYRRVKTVLPGELVVFGTALAAAAFAPEGGVGSKTYVTVCEFRITATFEGVTETFAGLTLENVPGRYFLDRINNNSALIDVSAPAAGTHPFLFPSAADGATIAFDTGGSDGSAPTALEIVGGGAPGVRTGIHALEDIDAVSIIAAPGLTDLAVQNALIEQCERLKDRFAVLDPAPPTGNDPPTMTSILNQRGQFDTKYAALYFPRLVMTNPLTDLDIPVPPSGHMAGIYARVDIDRGVHKAPANEVVRDILGFETIINKETQDLLNPSPTNINVFRDFRADFRGLRIWGARCITSDTEWKYINVRRLFIFLEESLDQGTQWVVFEPNDERLWARVRQSISAFLTRVWRDGALMGTKAEEAFFVKCDRSTMTQDDLDNGRLIVLIGVAPVKPAEFVIIRIGQFTASAQNSES